MLTVTEAAEKVDQRSAAAFGVTEFGEDSAARTYAPPDDVFRRVLFGVVDGDELEDLSSQAWAIAARVHTDQHEQSCREGTAGIYVAFAQQMLLLHYMREEG